MPQENAHIMKEGRSVALPEDVVSTAQTAARACRSHEYLLRSTLEMYTLHSTHNP